MKTHIDCIPCFFKQAVEAARLAGASRKRQKAVIDALGEILPRFSLESPPPEMGRVIHRLIRDITNKKDPYKKIKEKSNRLALRLYGRLKHKVSRSKDSLLTAVELAIAGNIIDYGVKNTLDVNKELRCILKKEERVIKTEDRRLFDYLSFKDALKDAESVLYLADNAGETVFDKVLIEEIKRLDKDKKIIYAVRGEPIINDALLKDAKACGIDRIVKVISSGIDAPGLILSLCRKKFLKIYRKADLIISKGQGNFEALYGKKGPIFFLFMAKCPAVAGDVGCDVGDIILLNNSKRRR